MSENSKPEEKQFSLKDIEMKMLDTIQQAYNTNLINFLTFVALERLAVSVTQNTEFRVDGNRLFITERENNDEEKSKEEVAVA